MIKFSVPEAGIHNVEGLDGLVRKAQEEGHKEGHSDASRNILAKIKKELDDPSPLPAAGEVAFAEAKRLLDGLPNKQQRKVLKAVRKDLREQQRKLHPKVRPLEIDIEWLRKGETGIEELTAWQDAPLILNKPPTTMLHQFRQDLLDNKVYDLSRINIACARPQIEEFDDLLSEASVFIVEHNWAAAFANAGDYATGEFHLPDEVCAFEFKISGRHIIAIVVETDGVISLQIIANSVSGWMMAGRIYRDHGQGIGWLPINRQDDSHTGQSELATMLGEQIKAIAIALDAEVAMSEVMRAPHKLNQARERRGKLPIFDYHVVSLAHRSRAPRLRSAAGEEGTYTHKRLHFRRGHWRHFENHKTWIKWMLVGDPELGFIDKHYKL